MIHEILKMKESTIPNRLYLSYLIIHSLVYFFVVVMCIYFLLRVISFDYYYRVTRINYYQCIAAWLCMLVWYIFRPNRFKSWNDLHLWKYIRALIFILIRCKADYNLAWRFQLSREGLHTICATEKFNRRSNGKKGGETWDLSDV